MNLRTLEVAELLQFLNEKCLEENATCQYKKQPIVEAC